MADAVALGDDEVAGLADDAVHDQPFVAFEDHHVACLDGARGAHDFEQVTWLHAGEHAGAGNGEARLAERSEDFGGEVEFEIGFRHADVGVSGWVG
jgi:hypothetical protein